MNLRNHNPYAGGVMKPTKCNILMFLAAVLFLASAHLDNIGW
jgi:hypothetical protein